MTSRQLAGIQGMIPLLVIAAVFLPSGCASFENLDLFGDECSRYESRAKSSRYNTLYKPASKKPADVKAAPKGVLAQVPVYKMAFDGDKIKPCSDLSIHKEIVLRRSDRPDLIFKETREFYAQDGTLIATNAEDISEQLTTSDTYQTVTPLPVPRSAPPGKYRIVSRLTVETKAGKNLLPLAKVEGVFYVVPATP